MEVIAVAVVEMHDSILVTIKKMLGYDEDYNAFDTDIIIFINSAMMAASQFGVGPPEGYRITGDTETWSDYLGENELLLEAIKSYIYFSVKLAHDPPSNSFVVTSFERQMKEAEWRLNVRAEEA